MEILLEIVVLWEEQKTGSHPYGSIAKASQQKYELRVGQLEVEGTYSDLAPPLT